MLLSSSSSHPSSVPSFLSLTFIIAVFLNFSAYASPVPHSLSTPATLSAPLPDLYLEKRVGIKDSFDADKIVAWLEKNKPADPSKLIFYTDVKVGKAMAATFCEHNPTYGYFYSIYGAAFAKDMGLVNGVYPPANLIVMSIAMGKWATGVTRVFNSQNGKFH